MWIIIATIINIVENVKEALSANACWAESVVHQTGAYSIVTASTMSVPAETVTLPCTTVSGILGRP